MFTVNVVHTFALSPAMEALFVANISEISTKVDDLKASTESKFGEALSYIQELTAEVADLKTKITDPAELDAVAAKLDANKADVDGKVIKPEVVPVPEPTA